MKAPLITMTILGLALVSYGVFSLLRQNQNFRAEVMKRLSNENQIKLTNLLNTPLDVGGRLAAIDSLDSTCTVPTPPGASADCNKPSAPPPPIPSAPANYAGQLPQALPEKTAELDSTKAGPAGTLSELQKIQKERKEALKELDSIK